MRYFYIFLGLVLVTGGFLAGFKLGLFLFPPKAQTYADLTQTYADLTKTNTESLKVNENVSKKNFCSDEIKFADESDKKFCFQQPKIIGGRGLEVNLTTSRALLFDQEKLIKILALSYQSPEDKWYQAPTGYYQAGIKHEKHLSSLFPVIMPYAIQFYEDFFIHGIPYYQDGIDVSSEFTGGCLRFANNLAEEIYNFIKTGDLIAVYKTFDDLKIKEEFHPPVDDLKNFWIRQRFNNPYRNSWSFSGTEYLKFDYYQHTGLDFAPNASSSEVSNGVYAISDGEIAKIQLNDGDDHGLGNTVIIEHKLKAGKIYSLYAHLSLIKTGLKKGDIIKKGEIIGEIGNSGYGCRNYWRIGEDGCESLAPADTHLHLEIKKAPTLENPEGGKACETPSGDSRFCYGYTPGYPQDYGYLDPIDFLFIRLNSR